MFSYDIINRKSINIDEEIVDQILNIISNKIKINQNWIINLIFVWKSEIQELNKKYRNKDKSTDVLSFHYFDSFENLKSEDIAWEIVFCEEFIQAQWVEYWLWSEKEFYKLLIHSVLHILWYDHEEDNDYKIMQEKENLIWSEVFEK